MKDKIIHITVQSNGDLWGVSENGRIYRLLFPATVNYKAIWKPIIESPSLEEEHTHNETTN